MSNLVALHHQTAYVFDRPVQLGPHVIRLRPTHRCRTPIGSYHLTVMPEPAALHWQEDPFGNLVARCLFQEPLEQLDVTVDLVADLTPINPFDFLVAPEAERMPVQYDDDLREAFQVYLRHESTGPLLAQLLASLDVPGTDAASFLVDLNQRLERDIDYQQRPHPGVWMPEETLERGVGSCRDTAWLLVQTLRRLGLAARFVSGYLIQLDVEADSSYPERPRSEDEAALHAWAEVYLPGAGWIGLDPTSGFLTAEGHIPLAVGPEPAAAAPVRGSTALCTPCLEFKMTVERVGRNEGTLS